MYAAAYNVPPQYASASNCTAVAVFVGALAAYVVVTQLAAAAALTTCGAGAALTMEAAKPRPAATTCCFPIPAKYCDGSGKDGREGGAGRRC